MDNSTTSNPINEGNENKKQVDEQEILKNSNDVNLNNEAADSNVKQQAEETQSELKSNKDFSDQEEYKDTCESLEHEVLETVNNEAFSSVESSNRPSVERDSQ